MSFESDVRRFAERTGRSLEQVVRAVCLATTKEVVERTPVLEGRLRGNWFATTGSPSAQSTSQTDPIGAATVSRAMPAIQDAPGKKWWLTNNLIYAIPIEFGGSPVKAPAGMVRVTAENITRNVRRAARENAPRP